jgi:hypothetical protein
LSKSGVLCMVAERNLEATKVAEYGCHKLSKYGNP